VNEDGARLAIPREHLPDAGEFLMWAPALQPYGYRIVDRLFATRPIPRGTARAMPRGAELDISYERDGIGRCIGGYMDRNAVAGLLVIRDGRIVLERYGLGLRPDERWSTMSTVKSITAILLGAALADGAIGSLDDEVVRYLPSLAGSAYDGVTIRHLLTMSSGAAWTEAYPDPGSDVNRYSRSLARRVPGGVLALMRSLARAQVPGTVWNYNSGESYLLGALISAATGRTLADFMAGKVWQPCGMEFDGFYTLEAEGGQEIGGSRAGMMLRDAGRFAQFVLDDGVVDGRCILPAGWVDAVAAPAFALPEPVSPGRAALGITHFGFSWWLTADGAMMALGHCGQRIWLHRGERLILVQFACYPDPQHAGPHEHHRDAELAALIAAIR
jgi:CubicO group peptidase (beta-lactamase class C family)